jgi:3-hydroxyisobutyrate dehydrogenase
MSSTRGIVAVLGTGIMGTPMAINLAAAGFEVRAWNRTRAKAEPLGDVATIADSPGEAVREADYVVTMLADADAVEAALDGERGALGAMRAPAALLQMSTVGVEATDRFARLASERGVPFVDAPVLGTKQPAEHAELIVLASGPDEERERCRPVFDALGQRVMWLGETGAGTRLKLVLNTWLLSLVEGLAEAIALAEALGVDPRRFLEAIEGGPLGPAYAQVKGELMIDRRFPASFPLRLAHKDARLALEAAWASGARLAALEAAAAQFASAVEAGHGEEDMAAAVYASLARG